jgi:hypothetical protein
MQRDSRVVDRIVVPEIDRIVVPEIDPCILDSIFPVPGRNDPCSCGSGVKYKKCCVEKGEEAWRAIQDVVKETAAVLAFLRTLPKSIYPEYDP